MVYDKSESTRRRFFILFFGNCKQLTLVNGKLTNGWRLRKALPTMETAISDCMSGKEYFASENLLLKLDQGFGKTQQRTRFKRVRTST